MFYIINFPSAMAIIAGACVSIPVFLIVNKTILKNNDLSKRGWNPQRLLAFILVILSFAVPAAIVYGLCYYM